MCSIASTRSCSVSRYAFVTEHTVGHVTFERLLRDAVTADPVIEAEWFPLTYAPQGAFEALPLLRSNWSARASVRARRLLAMHRGPWDALFFHTQTAALLAGGPMKRAPAVISLDATPVNLDHVAEGYDHHVAGPRVERAKAQIVGRTLRRAAALIAWSDWVRASLEEDYGVDPARIRVIPAGTRVPEQPPAREPNNRLRLLFVGGQFERKGGAVMLDAVAGLDVELDVVTQSEVPERPGVTVHRDIRPGSGVLDELYARSDVFVLPTAADASPHVVLEAMAAGLPVISTAVGAIPEMVRAGETGVLVEPQDEHALRAAIESFHDPARRSAMGAAAHARAREHFDATVNARRVLDVLAEVAR
jgi:glycosyltransferase involved in cell wall biosynthesis